MLDRVGVGAGFFLCLCAETGVGACSWRRMSRTFNIPFAMGSQGSRVGGLRRPSRSLRMREQAGCEIMGARAGQRGRQRGKLQLRTMSVGNGLAVVCAVYMVCSRGCCMLSTGTNCQEDKQGACIARASPLSSLGKVGLLTGLWCGTERRHAATRHTQGLVFVINNKTISKSFATHCTL